MILGVSVIEWTIRIFVAVCVFILAKWAIPLLFSLVGVAVPDQISTILALLIAVGIVWGWHVHGTVSPAA
jgi:hypothetical protein